MSESSLVYIDEYNLMGSNFYWKHRTKIKGVTDEDLKKVGLADDRVQVSEEIIGRLISIDKDLQEKGYRLYIKEGLRPKALYEVVYQKRVELFGKEATDRLLNMKDMPHASGKTVDVAIWDPKKDKEVYMRNGEDGDDAYFINFYKDKNDEVSKNYQALQDMVINLMLSYGFRLGTKREYFHFDYKPEMEPNY